MKLAVFTSAVMGLMQSLGPELMALCVPEKTIEEAEDCGDDPQAKTPPRAKEVKTVVPRQISTGWASWSPSWAIL